MADQSQFSNAGYDSAFAKFLAHTDEKEVLRREIVSRLIANNATSLLDIGAGNGDLAIALSRIVPRYLAVEAKPIYVAKLREAGLATIEGVFPVDMMGQFDMALACHSTPWGEEKYKEFVTGAFRYVSTGGSLLIVSYNDEESEWSALLRSCSMYVDEMSPVGYRLPRLKSFLESFGTVSVDIVTTIVRAHASADMIAALSFVYGQGKTERLNEFQSACSIISAYLRAHYFHDGSFAFPFHHVLFEVKT